MKLLKKKRAQSMIEYAILLAIVISAFLLLQGIVKRGVSGGINEAASRMGDQYSVTNTASQELRNMINDQWIIDETGTSKNMIDPILELLEIPTGPIKGSIDYKAHNITQRLDQSFTSTSQSLTDAASQETMRFSNAQVGTYSDFNIIP